MADNGVTARIFTKPGGSSDAMAELNEARQTAMREIGA